MDIRNLSKAQMAAVRWKRPIWIAPLALGVIAIAAAFCFAKDQASHYNELIMATGGWLITLAGILFAGNQAGRISLADAFSKLYEQEASNDQYYAKRLIYAFGRKVLTSPNRYTATRQLVSSYSTIKQKRLHEARRRLKHFWLLAEAYLESGLMKASEVLAVAGSPEILLSLEPLEVLAAEESEYPMKQGTWTSLRLLKKWYCITNAKHELRDMPINIPLDADLYDASLAIGKRNRLTSITALSSRR
jgi:hypothetical protein